MSLPPSSPPTPSSPPLPDRITVEALKRWLDRAPLPVAEIRSLDMGHYLVRFHHADRIALLVDDRGQPRRFTGTQWVSRLLAPLGFQHGVLTWEEVADEMIGALTSAGHAAAALDHGVRVAFATRG